MDDSTVRNDVTASNNRAVVPHPCATSIWGSIVAHMDELSIRIAERIRQAIQVRRITQVELATALRVSESTIQRRLNAERRFSVTEVARAAEFLNIPIAELMSP